jgi:hypothetical protein
MLPITNAAEVRLLHGIAHGGVSTVWSLATKQGACCGGKLLPQASYLVAVQAFQAMIRRPFLLFIALCCSSFPASLLAQETVGGIPWAIRMAWDHAEVPTVRAAAFDAEATRLDDEARDRAGVMPLYARFRPVNVDPVTAGRWYTLHNGDRIWRVRIVSPGAQALELFAQDFQIPEGATLHVYDDRAEQVMGGYTAYNRQPDGSFSTDMVHGESLIVEYYEPASVAGMGGFRITDVAHAYRMVGNERADPCQVDVICSEGANWQEQRDAVVRIRVVIPQGTGWCTGTLVNNTAQDCKAYILSAMHCSEGSSTANFNQYQFRFRYQRSDCGGGTVPSTVGNTVTGCTRRADSNDQGGDLGSDFVLLELNNPIPAGVNPFFAGWNVVNQSSASGVSIHHPAGSEKKISTYTSSLSNSGWGQIGTHWRVIWSATTNGHGVTEGGSSGSPIFDNNKRIVGTLTGGASCCTVNGCGQQTGPNAPDFYGKMSHHWTGNPNTAAQKLKVWLDPANTNVNVLDGSYTPCSSIGIEERSMDRSPLVYPNPGRDRITVQFPEGVVRADRIEVADISGRLVYQERPMGTGQSVIDVANWSAGTYLVTLVADDVRFAATKVTVTAQ